jgi:hypothetical protein
LPGHYGRNGLRPRLVLARWLARLGVLPMLNSIAVRTSIATTLLFLGVSVAGLGTAAAQPDYGALPVNPNTVTDSTAYVAAAPVQNPQGQPGVEAVFTHRDGTREITNTILILADAPAATAAMDQARSTLAGQVTASTTQPASVGTGATIVSGTSPDDAKSVAVLTFTEGSAFTTIEFEGPPNDPVPVDLVTEYGQHQATAIRDALSP